MAGKPTYEELARRVKELEARVSGSLPSGEQDSKFPDTYRLFFEKCRDAILIIKDQMFVDCNQATVDMLGYAHKEELLQTHPSQLSPPTQPDGRESFEKAQEMLAIAAEKGSHRFEWHHVKANGEVFPVEVLLTTLVSGDGDLVIHTTWRDITERKRAEENLKEERRLLSSILDSVPHGIVLTNRRGKYLYVNPFFTLITGYTLEDLSCKEAWFGLAYPDPESREKARTLWKNDRMQMGTGIRRDFRIQCSDGGFKDIEFNSSFLEDRCISVLTDVTQRRQAEEVRRERDRLQGVLELSGAVCHEMNQPLMNISGCLELLLMDMTEASPFYRKIKKIEEQLHRMVSITKKLMDISRYETKTYLEGRIVDLTKSAKP